MPYVHAFWEAGAAAFDRTDPWSDIDLYIVVDDDKIPETFAAVEKTLTALSPIQRKHAEAWPSTSGIEQAFYRLAKTDEYLLVDLAIMKLSAPDKFLAREIHGDAVFLFNKRDAVEIPPLDMEGFVRALLDRRKRVIERMELFGPFVPKEIHRGNWLEALEFYRALVLQSPCLGQRLGQAAHEAEDAYLRQVMRRERRLRHQTIGVGHRKRDDAPPVAVDHPRRQEARQIEQAVEVAGEHLAPGLRHH